MCSVAKRCSPTASIGVGPSILSGVPADHFAYVEPVIDWEIWIESGNNALPLRLAMTYKQVPNFLPFLVEFSDWNLNPKLSLDSIKFKIPAISRQIEFGAYRAEKNQIKWMSMNSTRIMNRLTMLLVSFGLVMSESFAAGA